MPELVKRGALVQGEDKVEAARKQGAAETAIGDLHDEASLRRAAEGVEGVFHIGPAFAPDEAEMGVRLVGAAEAAGVRKFCFSEAIHPSIARMRNHAAKRQVEEALYESGMTFTVLQPTMFMQTLAGGWKQVEATGTFGLPFSRQAKVSYVDYRDVAEAAALALTAADDRLAYGTFELCALGMVDRVEIAAMMSEALGKPVEAAEPSFEDWVEKAGIPSGPVREGMKAMYADYDEFGFPGGNGLVLEAVLGRKARGLRGYLGDLAGR